MFTETARYHYPALLTIYWSSVWRFSARSTGRVQAPQWIDIAADANAIRNVEQRLRREFHSSSVVNCNDEFAWQSFFINTVAARQHDRKSASQFNAL